jgi:hypothetical protein
MGAYSQALATLDAIAARNQDGTLGPNELLDDAKTTAVGRCRSPRLRRSRRCREWRSVALQKSTAQNQAGG